MAETRTRKNTKKSPGFSAEERAAMRDRARELKSTDGKQDLLASIAAMPDADRALAERLHELITASAPELAPRTWYGMPAYTRNDKVVCFFQGAYKFKARYATLGFSDKASLDDGEMWPVGFALRELTPAVEQRLVALVKQATACD
jgi:uncharacterized protein YdhG (YjbR/CyaY superfamily)